MGFLKLLRNKIRGLLTKIFRIGSGILKNKWIRTFFVIAITFVLAFPTPFIPPKYTTQLTKGEPTQKAPLTFATNINSLGAPALQRLLGIKLESMLGYISIHNITEVYDGARKINADDLWDKEGGSIMVSIAFNETIKKFIVPFASTTRFYPQSATGFAELNNEIKVHGFLPYGVPEVQIIDGKEFLVSKVYPNLTTIFNTEVRPGYDWKWDIFLKNYFLCLFGLIIVWSSVVQVYDWCFRNHKKD